MSKIVNCVTSLNCKSLNCNITPTLCTLYVIRKKLNFFKYKILKYPVSYTEDELACLLFDLENFPINQVLERFTKEGGIVIDII